MQGIKVYLKSEFDRFFRIVMVFIGLLLFVNGLKQFEVEHRPVLEVFLNCSLALLMLGTALLPSRFRKKLSKLPFFLILAASLLLWWNASRHLELYFSTWFLWCYRASFLVMALALSEPFLNRRRAAYFSPRRIRVPKFPAGSEQIEWSNVKNLDFGEQLINIELLNRPSISIKPSNTGDQHLRSRLDAIRLESKKKATE